MKITEILDLFWVNLLSKGFDFLEFFRVIVRYYSRKSFRRRDLYLLFLCLFHNPFKISRRYLQERGRECIHAYGETPLSTLETIAKECGLRKKDVVYELGSGTGRNCFWLGEFIGCTVVGVEKVEGLLQLGLSAQRKFCSGKVYFQYGNFLESNLEEATVIYVYGTCFEESFIKRMIERFREVSAGTKIVTVSYGLGEFEGGDLFREIKRFEVRFNWGKTEAVLQERI